MKAFLGLGTNIGNKESNLHLAVDNIKERVGEVISLSAFYASKPWGFSSENHFLNAALCVETSLTPQQLLTATQQIELLMGRKRKTKDGEYADRVIDIDVLFYEDVVIKTPQLIIPHPQMHLRGFVLEPLAEVAPDKVHPLLQMTIEEIFDDFLDECDDW